MILYVTNEVSYDRHNEKFNDICIITTEMTNVGWTEPWTPALLGPTIKAEIPEIRSTARVARNRGTVRIKDKIFDENICVSADPELFDILTIPLKEGTRENIFRERNSVVISENASRKFFGNRDPIGETITYESKQDSTYDLTITGVIKNLPSTSTFKADLIVPLFINENWFSRYWGKFKKNPLNDWSLGPFVTYVLLQKNGSQTQFESKLDRVTKNHLPPNSYEKFHPFPLKDLYFHSSEMVNIRFPQGNLTNVYIYSTAAFLLLLIACINFIILSTGTAGIRTREIGVRKVIGAERHNIIKQIATESLFIFILVIPVAFLLVEIFLPYVSRLLGKEIERNYFHNWGKLILFILIAISAGVLSGSYISIYLSKLNPIDILHNRFGSGSSGTLFRKLLITGQMIIFMGLILGSITIYKQLRYFHNKDFGFNKDEVLVFYGEDKSLRNNFDGFKNELKTNPDIMNVSGANMIPGTGSRMVVTLRSKDNPEKIVKVEGSEVDREFIKTMGMKITAGRDFEEADLQKSKRGYILNETAARELGMTNHVGETLDTWEIIGIVKDFNFHSLHEPIGPMFLSLGTNYINEIVVKVRKGKIPGSIQFVKEKSREFNGGSAMDFEFFDERLSQLYVEEEKFAAVIGYFTGLSIFVSCLGLFGMSLFIVQRRVKEIGVRKVLGASRWNILYLIAREFIILVLIASVITIPIAIYLISGWLQNFAYRIDVDIVIVAGTVAAALIITLSTVGIKVLKAAAANPVESLRYE